MSMRRWLVLGGVLLCVLMVCGVIGFAAWPRTEIVAQVELVPEPEEPEESAGVGPAEAVLLREWSFFGLRESFTLYAGQGVVVDSRPLTLCGTTYPVAEPGDPPSIEDVTHGSSGYTVRFSSGEIVTVPDSAVTTCR